MSTGNCGSGKNMKLIQVVGYAIGLYILKDLSSFYSHGLFPALSHFPPWPYLASQLLSLSCPVGPLRKLTLVTFDRYIYSESIPYIQDYDI